ncbi:MAG: stage V sporulation protein AC [Clostridiales bacterium]|nr:stage V sporulation protein AC [Clostridiales bacterium]
MDNSEYSKRKYHQMVDRVSPRSNILVNSFKAFCSGGAICAFGQALSNFFVTQGATKENAGIFASVSLIFITILLTGLGVFSKIGKHCGAGTFVPITGFANAMASPAIEYKSEGLVLGMAAKMFTVAGPVIVYGTLTSILVGLVYYFVK